MNRVTCGRVGVECASATVLLFVAAAGVRRGFPLQEFTVWGRIPPHYNDSLMYSHSTGAHALQKQPSAHEVPMHHEK